MTGFSNSGAQAGRTTAFDSLVTGNAGAFVAGLPYPFQTIIAPEPKLSGQLWVSLEIPDLAVSGNLRLSSPDDSMNIGYIRHGELAPMGVNSQWAGKLIIVPKPPANAANYIWVFDCTTGGGPFPPLKDIRLSLVGQ